MIFILYLLLGLAIVSTEVLRFSRYRSIDALTFFNGAYFLFFVFVPLNVLIIGEAAVRQKYVYQQFGYGDETTAMALLACYLLFIVGYAVKKSTVRESARSCHSLESDKGGAYSAYLHKAAAQISIIFLLIGFIGLSYHVALMGGMVEVIKNAPYVRSGEFGLEGKWLFLRQLSVFVATALILFWVVYDTKNKVSIVDTGLMLIMIIVFVFYALSTNGRREFWYLVILCSLVSFGAGNGFQFRQFALFVFGFVLWFVPLTLNSFEAFVPVTNAVVQVTKAAMPATNAAVIVTNVVVPVTNAAIAASYFKYVYLNTIQGLADTFMHFVGMQHASLRQFGFLADIAEIPLEFVPSSLFGFKRGRGFFGDTSVFFLGHPLGQGLSGEEPPGLHGYLLVNFGYIGMFLLFFLLGLIYKVLDNVLRPARRSDAVAWLIYWWVFFMFLEFFREGALILVLKPRASWWLAIGLLIYAKWSFENKRFQFQLESASRSMSSLPFANQKTNSILFLVRSLDRGGAERQLVVLAKGLARCGYSVSVAVFFSGGVFEAELAQSDVRLINLNKHGRWDVLPFLNRLVSLLRKERPTVLHSYLSVPNILAAALKPLLSSTRIIWGVRASNMNLSHYDWLSRLSYALERRLSRFADRIIANSHAGKRYAVASNFPENKLVVILNGIDTEYFIFDPEGRRQVRSVLGVGGHEILVGLVGRLDPMKDHSTFLEAASRIAHECHDVRFVCVGGGPANYAKALKQQAAALDLTNKLIWAGASDNMPAFYSALDIASSSSSYGEGFSNTIAEAMACGIPCVVTDVGDSALIVGEADSVVPPGDYHALAAAIQHLIDLPAAERLARGVSCRERVVSEFGIDRLIQRTEQALGLV